MTVRGWTDADEALLAREWCERDPRRTTRAFDREIAGIMGRSRAAVTIRRGLIGCTVARDECPLPQVTL